MGRNGRKVNRIRNELKQEFRLHRCLFHHYDVIDFVVFEFGMRVTYLVSRVLCMLIIPLLLVSIYDQFLFYDEIATPYSGLIYMHIWLSFLLVFSIIFEVGALLYAAVTLPTCDLVYESIVPWYFKVMWFMYNTIYVNILSCGAMYSIFQLKSKIGIQYYYFLMICAYAGIHCGTTAIPSRMGHLMHPFSLTLFHIFFTAIYQYGGGTDPTGARYVYDRMDWNYKIESILVAIFWCFLTLFFHVSLVFSSWTRRKLFRRLRKGKEAIINYDPDDASSVCSVDQDGDFYPDGTSPRIWIEDIPGDPSGHKRVIVDSSPPRRQEPSQYVFHEVYRDPGFPGEKRKRLILERSPPAPSGRRYCFAPADGLGGPPPYIKPRGNFDEPRGNQEKAYICHPEISPDGKSMIFTCMPEKSRRTECYHCEDERRGDRAEVHKQSGYPSYPQNKLHSFVMNQPLPVPQPVTCPRSSYEGCKLSSMDTQQQFKKPDRNVSDDERSGSCLSRPKKSSQKKGEAPEKETKDIQTYCTSAPEEHGTVIW